MTPSGDLPSSSFLRRSEWIITAYFAYTAILAQFLPVPATVPRVTLLLNTAILGGLALLAYAHSLRGRRLLGIIRDWYPMPLALLAYREMGWFARREHTYALEQSWVVWDRLLLNDWGLRAAIERLGPTVPALLEISYSLVYAIAPFAMAMLYAYGRRKFVDSFLYTFLLGVLGCYVLFPLFPSEPPRTAFPGADYPSVETVFRRFNFWLLGGYGIHTSVFPSAHVAGAFSAAWAIWRLLPGQVWVRWLLPVLAVLIATATVYGRYHFAVDALAGFVMSLVAAGITRIVDRRMQ